MTLANRLRTNRFAEVQRRLQRLCLSLAGNQPPATQPSKEKTVDDMQVPNTGGLKYHQDNDCSIGKCRSRNGCPTENWAGLDEKKKTEVLPQFQLLREEQEKWELYVLQGTRIRSTMVSSVDELPDFHVNAERTRSSRSHIYVYFAHFSPSCKNNQARLGNAMADSALSPSEETLLITQNSLFERTFKGNMGIQCR